MAPKKTVIKVDIHCDKCKTDVLTSVAKLTGIDQVTVDREKGTLTVVGEVDPVSIVKQVKKVGKYGDIISVGPNKPVVKPPCPFMIPPCGSYYNNQLIPVSYCDTSSQCNIM